MLTLCSEHLKLSLWSQTGNLMYYLGININISDIILTDNHHHLTETEFFHSISTLIKCQKNPKLLQTTPCNKSFPFYQKHSLQYIYIYLPQRNPIFHTNDCSSLRTVTEADRIIYLELKLWCHMSSLSLALPQTFTSTFHGYLTFLPWFPQLHKGLFCWFYYFFKTTQNCPKPSWKRQDNQPCPVALVS